jgi:O-antigen ligase
MTIFEVIFTLVYLLITLGATLLVVTAFAFALHGEHLWGTRFVPAIVSLITLGIAMSSLLSNRNLALAAQHIDKILQRTGSGTAVLQLITLAILSIAAAKLIGAIVRRNSETDAPGTPLFIALMVYIAANSFFPSAFGSVPAFVHSMIYPVLIFSAAWAARREAPDTTIRTAKAALQALMVGSLVAALLVPAVAVQPDYVGLIPGLKMRLWGLGSNPNSTGALALLTLLLEYLYPTRKPWLRALLMLATGTVLVLTQSKTVWVALPIVLTILAWYRWVRGRGQEAGTMFVLVFIGVASALLAALMFVDVSVLWEHFSDSDLGDSVTTVSGRTGIWEVALREWLRNPLFGYGPEIWGLRFRQEIGMPYAFSAHNQFMQTLSAAGTLGLLSLLAYLRYAIPAALRAAASTRGVSVALLGMILFRCLSETPLSMTGLVDGDALTHFLLFVIILRAPDSGLAPRNIQPALAGQHP